MNNLSGVLESLLLVSGKPLAISTLAKLLEVETADVERAVSELEEKYNRDESGIRVMVNAKSVQLATNPAYKEQVTSLIHDETTGELTKPSLEALTIIAYRQPITKEELEQIRGVNCNLILRNLLIRGLIETNESRGGLSVTFNVTMDFLRFLGITRVEDLPDYARLNSSEAIESAIAVATPEASQAPSGLSV